MAGTAVRPGVPTCGIFDATIRRGMWTQSGTVARRGAMAMRRFLPRVLPSLFVVLVLVVLAVSSPLVIAGSHTWKFVEAFSNADGTIQFIEFGELNGVTGENAINGHTMSSTTKFFSIGGSPVPGSTAFKRFLVATPAFAALPGAPTPDRILPAGQVPFFSRVNDTLACSGWPSMIFTAGQLPTDGIHSLTASASGTCSPCTVTVNSPKNYAGATGSVDVSPGPPTIADGSPGTPMTVAKLDESGTSLSVSFDTALCQGVITSGPHLIYGEKSQLPGTLGGPYGVSGGACGISASPYTWNPTPDSVDGSGLIWWLVVAEKGTKEGGWGRDSAGSERNGSTSSGQCGMTSKDLSNVCGN